MMPGRLTGTARHLTDPANKIYIATMEEGLYSVEVKTLAVEEHIKDGNKQPRIGQGERLFRPLSDDRLRQEVRESGKLRGHLSHVRMRRVYNFRRER
jgi:hypothetical protein